MKNTTDFAKNVSSFLTDYLPNKRNYSKNTVLSYKDTIKLFLRFISEEKGKDINMFTMKEFTRELVVEFLNYIHNQGASISTSNQRLAALKSFSQYCQLNSIEYMEPIQSVMSIKSKKTTDKLVDYLTEEQIRELINKPGIETPMRYKHKLILCLLYDTGARVQEICNLRVKDISFQKISTIKLTGKGNKTRFVPISNELSQFLLDYIHQFKKTYKDEFLVLNKDGHQMSRDGIEYIIKKYTSEIHMINPTFPEKVHPHMFRHSKAVHMVSANVPLIYIRDFLGHKDISTTMIYAKADIKQKQKAIDSLVPKLIENETNKEWIDDFELMTFLDTFK